MDQFAISIFYMNKRAQSKVKRLAMTIMQVSGGAGI